MLAATSVTPTPPSTQYCHPETLMTEPRDGAHQYFTIPDPINRPFASSLEILIHLIQHDNFRREMFRAAQTLRTHSVEIVCVYHDKLMNPFILTRQTTEEVFKEEIDERLDMEAGLLLRIAAHHPALLRFVLNFQEYVLDEPPASETRSTTRGDFTIPNPLDHPFASTMEILIYLTQHDDFRREILSAAHVLHTCPSHIIRICHDQLSDPFVITYRTTDDIFKAEIDECLDVEAGLLIHIAAGEPALLHIILVFQEFVLDQLLSDPS